MERIFITEQLVFITTEFAQLKHGTLLFNGNVHVNQLYKDRNSGYIIGQMVAQNVAIVLPEATPSYSILK